ncbi:MAG: GTPase Era, partial [Oligoflexia bacterium]|nr:GTPase Era [Oligoflexia bacterium]
MLITNQNPHNKSIMLGVIGVPNVGKSSLINYLIGLDLSAVTHKPQTTRNHFHCIFTIDKVEVILVDTPGFHKSTQEINVRMNQEARDGGEGTDVNLLLLDLSKNIETQLKEFKNTYIVRNTNNETNKSNKLNVWPVFTKSDLLEGADQIVKDKCLEICKNELGDVSKYFVVSSMNGDGMHELVGAICDNAPNGPHLYNKGQMSNKNERFFVAEYIREQAFNILREEIPYELAVIINEYKEIDSTIEERETGRIDNADSVNSANNVKMNEKIPVVARIEATIIVNRQSQRAIVVGSKGATIKEIGSLARVKIEEMVGGKVF